MSDKYADMPQDPKDVEEKPLSELTWDELLVKREALLQFIENLEAAKAALSEEFMARLQQEKISGKVVGNWSISKATRITFKLTVDQAREFGAVKESVDQTVLKNAYFNGAQVPGMQKTEYPIVREVEKKNE